ncbi:carbohydrate ABC transporter permease [Clostridium merdae]|uniref:carbohydrate ABC transporter permease n=1 Tax=Clostridium merdae TaxID=1958780 RepID=UPI000A270330|nr:carbohydrate ABC transporter permease [Clostridium merdae]
MKQAKLRKKFHVGQLILILIMGSFILTILIPLLHIVAKSFSSPSLSPMMKGLDIIPQGFSLINYQIILSNPVLVPSLMTSIFITVVGTVLNMLLTISAAYVLTRPNLVGKRIFMIFFIIMMLFDPGLVPEYFVVKDLGLIGSRWSVILSLAVNVYYLIIMMRYFEEIPLSIYEAAKIDGAGHIRTLFSIATPLCRSGIATLTMFYAVLRWNEYLRSGVYISKLKDSVLQVVLRKFLVEGDTTTLIGAQNLLNYNELAKIDYMALSYAVIVIAIIPILVLFPLVLKYYTKDVMAGGVKG